MVLVYAAPDAIMCSEMTLTSVALPFVLETQPPLTSAAAPVAIDATRLALRVLCASLDAARELNDVKYYYCCNRSFYFGDQLQGKQGVFDTRHPSASSSGTRDALPSNT